MSKYNPYDPEAERTCRGCHKMLKTKQGILKDKYTFYCAECHQWYRNWNRWQTGIIAVSVIVIFLVALGLLVWLLKKEDKDRNKGL